MQIDPQPQSQPANYFRKKFFQTIDISSSHRTVVKGKLDYTDVVQKVIRCKQQKDLFFRYVLMKRLQTSISLKGKQCFKKEVEVETVEDKQITHLLLFSQYLPHPSKSMVEFCKTAPNAQEKVLRMCKLLKKCILELMIKSNHQFFTYQNFLFDQDFGQFSLGINITSFVGMELILNNEQIRYQDFVEICQLLESDTLDKQPDERMTLQLKFRAIGVLLLSFIFEKRFHIKMNNFNEGPTEVVEHMQIYRRIFADIKKEFTRMLNSQIIKSKIQKLENEKNTQYYKFLTLVFVEEQKLTWNDVIDMLLPKIAKNNKQHDPIFNISTLAKQIYLQNEDKPYKKTLIDELGLADRKLFPIILLYDHNTQVEDLLFFEDIDDILLKKTNFSIKSRAVFFRLFYLTNLVKNQVKDSLVDYMEQFHPKFKLEPNQKQLQQIKEMQGDHKGYLNVITSNYGTLKQKAKKKTTFSTKEQNITIRKYQKAFF